MHPSTLQGFSDEMEKLAYQQMEKEAIFETARVGWKAGKQALLGGRRLVADPGMHHEARVNAVRRGNRLMTTLDDQGFKVHRARVKTPESMAAKGMTESSAVPDDLLGMQLYGKSPRDVQRIVEQLRAQGVTGIAQSVKVKPGYHGVNIKGTYRGTPMEMQVSPSRVSNAGNIMEHSLGYKVKTEAPRANWFDKWVGKKVAPQMVKARSWVPQMNTQPARRALPQPAAVGAY